MKGNGAFESCRVVLFPKGHLGGAEKPGKPVSCTNCMFNGGGNKCGFRPELKPSAQQVEWLLKIDPAHAPLRAYLKVAVAEEATAEETAAKAKAAPVHTEKVDKGGNRTNTRDVNRKKHGHEEGGESPTSTPLKRQKTTDTEAKSSDQKPDPFGPVSYVQTAPGPPYNPLWYSSPLYDDAVQEFFRNNKFTPEEARKGRLLARDIAAISARSNKDFIRIRKLLRAQKTTADDWDGEMSDAEEEKKKNPFLDD